MPKPLPISKKFAAKELAHYLAVAKKAALAGGKVARKGFFAFDRGEVQYKKRFRELFSHQDQIVELAVRKEIIRHFPEHSINGEEQKRREKNSDFVWQIDPIDGTVNFTIHDPNFNVSVALQYKGQSIAAVLYSPIVDEMFWATPGGGAWLNSKRIKVSKMKKLSDSMLNMGWAHDDRQNGPAYKWFTKLKKQKIKVRSIGAASVHIVGVACGRLDGNIQPQMAVWDVAAAQLIASEAGARTTDRYGKPVKHYNDYVITTNGLIHDQLIKALR